MLTFVKSVLLCGSVRERMQEARWGRVSLTELTVASPPAPLRMERGVITEIPL